MMSQDKKKYTLNDCEASKEQILYANLLFYGAWSAILILTITFGLYVFKVLPRHIPLAEVPNYWHERAGSWLNPWYALKEPVKVPEAEKAREKVPPEGASLKDISEEKIAMAMKQKMSSKGETGMDKNVAVMETAEALGLDPHDDKVEEKLGGVFAGFKDQGLLTQVKPDNPQGWDWIYMLKKGEFLNFIGIVLLAGMTILCFLVALLPAYLKQKDWPYFALVIFECAVLILAASGILKVGGH